jgi:hypothetical protein
MNNRRDSVAILKISVVFYYCGYEEAAKFKIKHLSFTSLSNINKCFITRNISICTKM